MVNKVKCVKKLRGINLHIILKVNRSALVTGRGVILQVSLKLHFACWEGLVLHGDSAVASKYCD